MEPHYGLGLQNKLLGEVPPDSGKKVKVLTAEGKLVEVDSSLVTTMLQDMNLGEDQFREGIAGKIREGDWSCPVVQMKGNVLKDVRRCITHYLL